MYDMKEIQATVKRIAAMSDISKVTLVGSYARGVATEQSDIDLVIDGKDLSESYWDFLFELEDSLCKKVDLMTVRGLKNSCIRDRVLAEGIILYET
ncbi:MAG: nucleotidyltransferase domain-containing protein [Oscillospiraceae bacterium]|nr:nucleotidyltransferase domain-containing protein [Oscillospiraceae bacterium]